MQATPPPSYHLDLVSWLAIGHVHAGGCGLLVM